MKLQLKYPKEKKSASPLIISGSAYTIIVKRLMISVPGNLLPDHMTPRIRRREYDGLLTRLLHIKSLVQPFFEGERPCCVHLFS